jgi:hypothetical protein
MFKHTPITCLQINQNLKQYKQHIQQFKVYKMEPKKFRNSSGMDSGSKTVAARLLHAPPATGGAWMHAPPRKQPGNRAVETGFFSSSLLHWRPRRDLQNNKNATTRSILSFLNLFLPLLDLLLSPSSSDSKYTMRGGRCVRPRWCVAAAGGSGSVGQTGRWWCRRMSGGQIWGRGRRCARATARGRRRTDLGFVGAVVSGCYL